MIAFLLAGVCYPYTAQAQCDFPATTTLRVLLEGPLDTTTMLMNDELRTAGLLPLAEPYTALGHQFRGGGNETIDPSVLLPEGPDAIVDWVVVEVRHANDPGRVLYSRSALLQRDGDVVGLDGLNSVQLCVEVGKYHIAVRHRNHLGIMTGSPLEYYHGQFGILFCDPVDLSSPQTDTYRNSQARRKMGVGMAMWSGDVSFDGKVQYTGEGNDRDLVLQAIGGVVPTSTATGYGSSDLNLDGSTRYTGDGNDRDQILRTIGGAVPTNIREGYLPKDSLTLRPNVHLVDALSLILDPSRSDLDSNTIMVYAITGTIPEIMAQHIVVGEDPNGGYLRKVINAIVQNDSLYLTTSQGNLADIYGSGVLSFEIPNDGSQGFAQRGVYYAENQELFTSGAFNVSLEDISINYSGTPFCEIDFEELEVKSAEIGIKNINIGLDYQLKFEGTLFNDSTERTFLDIEVNRGAVILPGGIPLFWITVLKVGVEAKVEVFGEVNTSTQASVDLNATIGARYDQATGFSSINTFELPSPHLTSKVTEAAAGLKASVSLQAEVQCQLYKVGGPYFSTGPEGEVTLRSTALIGGTSDYDLKAEAKWSTSAGVKAEIMGLEEDHAFTYESDPFIEFNTPHRLDTTAATGKRQIGVLGEPLQHPLKMKVLSKRTFPFLPTTEEGAWLVPVNFQVISGGGSLTEERVFTDLDGFASTSWTLGDSINEPQRVRAFVLNGAGDTIPTAYIFTADTADLHMEYVSGDRQIGSVNSDLPDPLVVRVLDQNDNPVAGYPVHFDVVEGNGEVSEELVPTDPDGLASTIFTLGPDAAEQHQVIAYALTFWEDTIRNAPIPFKAYVDPDTMFYAALSGNLQSGEANTVLPVDLRVQVNSVLGQEPQEDVLVFFEVISGGGSVSSFATSTNSDGIASVSWTLGPDLSIRQKVKAWALDVYGDTLRGGPLEFEACTIICPPTATDVDGNVYNVVKIGCDCWFQENVRTHHLNNGDPIQHVAMDIAIPCCSPDYSNSLTDPIWFTPASSQDTDPQYESDGLVYNLAAFQDPRGICPTGWRIPVSDDMRRMVSSLALSTDINGSPDGVLFRNWPGEFGTSNFTGFSQRTGRYVHGPISLDATHVRFNWDPWFTSVDTPHTGMWWGQIVYHTYLGSSIAEGPVQGGYNSPIFTYCRCVMD